jgi:hypothetical protein
MPNLGCEQDGEEQSIPFCHHLTFVQVGVRLGIVMKEDIFHVLVRINSMDALLQFAYGFHVPHMIFSEVEAGNFTTLVFRVLLNIGKNCAENDGVFVGK